MFDIIVAKVKLQGLKVHFVFRDRPNLFLPRAAGVFSRALLSPTPTQASGTQRDPANLSAAHKSLHYSGCVCVYGGGGDRGGGVLPLSYWQCSFRFLRRR